jgi:DNA-binding MarR family transcriptional regulator
MTLMKPAPHREALPLFGPAALLGGVRKALHAALDARLASDEVLFPLELTTAQLIIVMMLAGGEPISSADLCERMSYDTGAMTRMLDRLQSKGVIRRRRSLEDRRVVEVELTQEGRAGLSRMREISTEVSDELLRGFTTAEVLRLESYLARLLVNAQS